MYATLLWSTFHIYLASYQTELLSHYTLICTCSLCFFFIKFKKN